MTSSREEVGSVAVVEAQADDAANAASSGTRPARPPRANRVIAACIGGPGAFLNTCFWTAAPLGRYIRRS
jgi:hypothetical protein